MTYLLDVSTLVALLVGDHEFNETAARWLDGKEIAVCPLTELGFLRVAGLVYDQSQNEARQSLKFFKQKSAAKFIPDDISALAGEHFPSARKSTDWYLANLAQEHGMKWATLDAGANHPTAELIS